MRRLLPLLVIIAILGAVAFLLYQFRIRERIAMDRVTSPASSSNTSFRSFAEQKFLDEANFERLSVPLQLPEAVTNDVLTLIYPSSLRRPEGKKNTTLFLLVSNRPQDPTWNETLEKSIKDALISNDLQSESPTTAIINVSELKTDTLRQIKARITSIMQEVHGDYQVKNFVVGVSDSHSCDSQSMSVIEDFARKEPINTVLIYDGCYGDVITPDAFQLPSGINIFLGSYVNTSGVGAKKPTGSRNIFTNADSLIQTWRLGTTLSKTVSTCAQNNPGARLLEKPTGPQRKPSALTLGILLDQDNRTNVRAMTNIAFCALYRSTP